MLLRLTDVDTYYGEIHILQRLSLEVGEGDLLRLVALGFSEGRARFRYQSVRVTGTYRTGFAEFDRSWMVLSRELVVKLSGGSGSSLFTSRPM